jgi:enoyl-CoA hydratase/carnithine racemase
MSRAYRTIKVARAAGIETITLNVPQRRNAIGPQMANELLWALEDAVAAEDVRVVVLAAEGKVFCAGGDFAQMTGGADGGGEPLAYKGDYADLLLAMAHTEKPIVARVHGPAMGGGFGLVAACTFAIAVEDAQMGTPEIEVGLFPMMIMAVLRRFVPRRRLLQMMLLGEKFSAGEALAMGILNKVVPAAELDKAVGDLTATLASKSPTATRHGLRAFAAQDDLDLAAALPMLRGRLADCLGTEDAREGLMAFLEKRAAKWTGR